MSLADRLVLRLVLAGACPANNSHIILNSPGSGNIGDQAMFESFVKNVPGHIVAVVKSPDAYALPEGLDPDRVSFLVLPNLVYSKGPAHYRDLRQLGQAIRSAESFSIMGADIMDGGYGIHSSVVEWNLARTVQDAGIPARVLGFSWNGRAPKEVVRQARLAGHSGVRILSRDPDSHKRLLDDDIESIVQSSDMVFSFLDDLTIHMPAPAIMNWQNPEEKLAVVNISGLIGATIDQNVEYEHFLAALEELGYKCLLLPHVSHSNVNDIAAIAQLRVESAAARRAIFIDTLLSPAEVLSIVKRSEVVVTGRMHLSILALLAGRPVIALATQGKVSGLMRLFDLPDHCVEPTEGFGKRVARLLVHLEANRHTVITKVTSNLPTVRRLSQKNFELFESR
nr:polysaccharide pyruvyl transferase family protein [Arthrobacter sp. efr-133-TYG-118]